MRQRKLLVFAVFLFISCIATAQKARTAAPASAAPVQRPLNSVLFEISGRRLQHSSWIFGTMHMVCEQDANLSIGLKQVIASSEKIFFELNIDDMTSMMGALKFLKMNGDQKLSTLLTPVEYARVKSYFDAHPLQLPLAFMDRFKPYFITAMLSENLLTCEKKASMEQLILAEGKKQGKVFDGLETVEFQASLFDSIPYDKQAQDLVKYVDSIGEYRKVMEATVDKYRKQDLVGIDSLMERSEPGMSEFMDLVLYQRNQRWNDQITEQVYRQPTLFAVGAGHLGGEKGVIALLRKQGFTVKAVRN